MIAACDPGLKGAFAFWTPERDRFLTLKMPTFQNGAGKNVIDEAAVVQHLRGSDWDNIRPADNTLVIETVGGIPGQSAHAAFVFGYGVGVIITCARMLGWRIERVTPQRWKAALNCPRDKPGARARASELLPQWAEHWPLKGDDGVAEAALLAYYGQTVLGLK